MLTILDETSMARTLWNLEEARLAGAHTDDAPVSAALAWVQSRRGLPGAYCGVLFAPTPADRADRIVTPTGERSSTGGGGLAHMLGEEAARSLTLWESPGWDSEAVFASIRDRFRAQGHAPDERLARFCCAKCSVARWRALAAGKPRGWEDVLRDALRILADSADAGGRWRGMPFYYTLSALSDMPLAEVDAERRRIRPAAERLLARHRGDDQPSRFRRRALQWAAR